jgi:DNA-binding NarL/FixJ family response regulator
MNNIQFNQEIYKRLAPREVETARAAAAGLSIKQTAIQMGIAFDTAKNYRARIMKKLGCKNITETVVSLKNAGIL